MITGWYQLFTTAQLHTFAVSLSSCCCLLKIREPSTSPSPPSHHRFTSFIGFVVSSAHLSQRVVNLRRQRQDSMLLLLLLLRAIAKLFFVPWILILQLLVIVWTERCAFILLHLSSSASCFIMISNSPLISNPPPALMCFLPSCVSPCDRLPLHDVLHLCPIIPTSLVYSLCLCAPCSLCHCVFALRNKCSRILPSVFAL